MESKESNLFRPLRVPASIETGALNLSATSRGCSVFYGRTPHAIHGDRERRRRRLGPLIADEIRSFRLRDQAVAGRRIRRFEAEMQDSASRTAIAMQLAERADNH